jgi:hypothetical protein
MSLSCWSGCHRLNLRLESANYEIESKVKLSVEIALTHNARDLRQMWGQALRQRLHDPHQALDV